MAGLSKRILSLVKVVPRIQAVRGVAQWNELWKPGPYPHTEAERIAAARKYGMLVEDYEPYPDDGMGYGDYPKFDIISMDARDPYEEYDTHIHRRNYGEVLHVDFDMYNVHRMTTEHKYPVSPFWMFVQLVAPCILIAVGMYLTEDWLPVEKKPKQFPHQGVVHYTFEKAE